MKEQRLTLGRTAALAEEPGQHTGGCVNFKEGKGSIAAAYGEHYFSAHHERELQCFDLIYPLLKGFSVRKSGGVFFPPNITVLQ